MIEVSADVLEALGGLAEDDPPVLCAGYRAELGEQVEAWHPLHTHGLNSSASGALLLPASAPALLRVLARHLGMELEPGEVPDWDLVWWNGYNALLTVKTEGGDQRKGWTPDEVPALAGITDPMAALVIVLIHVAVEARDAD